MGEGLIEMDFSAFVTSLTTYFLVFLVLMLLYPWLSRKPGNNVVYYPNRILKGLEPWEGSRTWNPFAWILEALRFTEKDVISMSGVDTAVYLVFLSSVLGILVLSGLVLLPVLLPVAATEHTNSTTSGNFTRLDKLSMPNIPKNSPRLWAYLICTYWVSFVTFYILWKANKYVADLRAKAFMSPVVKPEQFAVLVRDIPQVPEGLTRKEQVDSYFRTIHSETFYRSMVVTDNNQANKIWEELEGYRKKLAHADAIFAASQTERRPEGIRPTNKLYLFGLVGKKVDTINHCNEKINELIPKLKSEQKITIREKQQGAAIVFFNSKPAAASAAQAVHAQMLDSWTVTEAPEPRQLVWSNLAMKFYMRKIRQCIIYVVVALLIVFYMIPISFVSAFTTLDNLKKLLPFLKSIVDVVEIKTILEAYLPQTALYVFLFLLPKFLMMLSKAEGITSEAHSVRASSGKYFYFTVLNVFIGTIGGSLLVTLKIIEKDPNSVITLLGMGLPANATFFLTYVALQFFVGYGLELSRLVPLIIFHLKRKYLCKTVAELKEAWVPGDLCYTTRAPNDMLIVTIVLCYSVIVPIIIPFGVVYFGLGWLVLRNQALKVYVPSYESYGRMWPHLHSRILAALVVYQITMFGYFGLKEFVYMVLLIPLPIFSIIFAYVSYLKFCNSISSTPLEVACQELKEIPNMESIFKEFIPACLRSEKFNDGDQFEDALAPFSFSRSGSSL